MRYYLHFKETENEKKLSSLSKVTRWYVAESDFELGLVCKAQASLLCSSTGDITEGWQVEMKLLLHQTTILPDYSGNGEVSAPCFALRNRLRATNWAFVRQTLYHTYCFIRSSQTLGSWCY